MGTDIHMFAEVRNSEGKWEKVGKIFDNPYYDPEGETKVYDGWIGNDPKTDEPYKGRNYALFSLLAGVRNGYGFAGIRTYNPVQPLFEDRGTPEDASEEYKAMLEDWGVDAHSHSYATLEELLAVDWDSAARFDRVGYLDTTEYERIRGTGLTPETWVGDASGPFIQKITAEVYEREYRNVIEDKATDADEMMSVYIYWTWSDFPTDIMDDFITGTINKLRQQSNPEDVRILFYFDS